MKLSAITTAVVFAGMVGIAAAADQGNSLPPISVTGAAISECTPPNDGMGHVCDSYSAFVRANFTRHEIQLLFGCSICSPEYLSGGTERLQKRYQKLLQQYLAAQLAAQQVAKVTAK